MRHFFLIVITLSSLAQADGYRPLSRKDRRDFVQAYHAVKVAFKQSNFGAIFRFAPGIITRFESVILDPDCAKLRPYYHELKDILFRVRDHRKIDSLEAGLNHERSIGDTKDLLLAYDSALPIMKALDIHTYIRHKKTYDSLVTALPGPKTMSEYSFLASLSCIDSSYIERYRESIQDKFDARMAQLSASMNADSILAFQKSYPTVQSDDVAALLERSRIALKQSLSRRPSLPGYLGYRNLFGDDPMLKEIILIQTLKLSLYPTANPTPLREYIRVFPDDEQSVWAAFEDSLYVEWQSGDDLERAREYLRLYPQGRYATVVKDAIRPIEPFSVLTETAPPAGDGERW